MCVCWWVACGRGVCVHVYVCKKNIKVTYLWVNFFCEILQIGKNH